MCERFCPTGAIDYEQEDQILELKVGAIVLATGFHMWDPAQLPDYAYGKSPNVITGLEFERLTSVSGPTGGKIVTAEGKTPERVAIIHCVGSRDERAHAYCSRFCCMYSLKQAHQVQERPAPRSMTSTWTCAPLARRTRNSTAGCARKESSFVQGRPSQITEDPTTKKLYVEAEDILLGQVIEVEVDMVILANAIEPQPDADQDWLRSLA